MALTTPALLEGIDMHYETENRLVRNERERRNEERELVDGSQPGVAAGQRSN